MKVRVIRLIFLSQQEIASDLNENFQWFAGCEEYEDKTLLPNRSAGDSSNSTPDSGPSQSTDSDTYSSNFERSVEEGTLTRSISGNKIFILLLPCEIITSYINFNKFFLYFAGPDSYNFDQVSEDYENLSLKIKNVLRSLSTPEDLKSGVNRNSSFNYSENSYPMGNFPYDDSLKRWVSTKILISNNNEGGEGRGRR